MARNPLPVELTDAVGKALDVLAVAPGADTGQLALAVRIISDLSASAVVSDVNVTDRVARLLGHVTVDNITGETAGVGIGAAADAAAAGNGSLIAVAKQLRVLLAAGLPAALVGGRLDVNNGTWMGSAAPTVGQKTMANSLPVTLASDQTVIKAREDAAAMTWNSVKSAAPGIGALQATTGALAAGDYDFDIYLLVSDTVAVGKGLVIEHRNAADAATLQNLGGCSTQGEIEIRLRRYTLALNERIRVITGTAAGAAASMYVSAIGRRVS